MDIGDLKDLLSRVRKGKVSLEEALRHLKDLPYKDIGFARVDSHRALRCGFPEVIFCQGKTPQQVVAIARQIIKGEKLKGELEQQGITVRAGSFSGLAEEAGQAYKEINDVIDALAKAGISKPVTKLIPIGNVKG